MEKSAEPLVIVVGALNLDVCGVPSGPLRLGDSNPGRVSFRAGGVGRNIASHIAENGIAAELCAALGDDHASDLLTRLCRADGIGLRHALCFPGASGCYLCIHGDSGDMVAAINDMSLSDHMTPDRLLPLLPVLNAASLVVLDANLPADTIELLATNVRAPLLLDPVSGFKAERAKPVIGRFAAVKPNALEARALSGEDSVSRAAEWFLARGIRRVFISLGADGVFYADSQERGTLPSPDLRAPNYTGAGDAMTAGIAIGLLRGASARECAMIGNQIVSRHLLRQGGTRT